MEFIEEFLPHKRYVFDKDIYIEYAMKVDTYTGDDPLEELWINKCHNQFVDILNERDGVIGGYGMIPEWCREVPVIRVLTVDNI